MMRTQRKASLNLSIEAIIIIVLAMTLLGLGLAFIRSQLGKIQTTGTEVQEQVREQIVGQLRASGEKVSFPRSLQFSRGEQKVVTLGVQNTQNAPLYFIIKLGLDACNSDLPAGTDCKLPDATNYLKDKFDIRYQKDCITLSPSQAEVYGINVGAPTIGGTFALKAEVQQYLPPTAGQETCTTPDPVQPLYATKLSFINVG